MKLLVLAVAGLSFNALADTCGVSYSHHMSRTSDLGSDMKHGSIVCEKDSGSYELGFQALTPPNGTWSRTPVYPL